jgi:hypothetical protein
VRTYASHREPDSRWWHLKLPISLPEYPNPPLITGAPPIRPKADHVASEWPITLNELGSIFLNKPPDGLRLLLQLPDGGRWDRSEARELACDLVVQAAGRPAPSPDFQRLALHRPPPAHAWSRQHPLGVIGEPAAGRRPNSVRTPRG